MRAIIVLLMICLAGCSGSGGSEKTDGNDAASWGLEKFWGNADRLTVMDEVISTTAFMGGEGGAFTRFQPQSGIVPPGTDHLSIVITQVVTARKHGEPTLTYQTAQNDEWHAVEGFAMGTPSIINVPARGADPPGQGITSWSFALHYPPYVTEAPTYSVSEAHVSITAFKDTALPTLKQRAPWTGERLELFSSAGVASGAYSGNDCIGITGCPGPQRPDVPVPVEARVIEVQVEHVASTPPTLLFHGPDSWRWQEAHLALSAPRQTVFRIPVETADSPFAHKSAWGFELRGDTPTSLDPFVGSYEVTAYALA